MVSSHPRPCKQEDYASLSVRLEGSVSYPGLQNEPLCLGKAQAIHCEALAEGNHLYRTFPLQGPFLLAVSQH